MFDTKIQNYDKHDFTKFEYSTLKIYYKIMEHIFNTFSNIIPIHGLSNRLYFKGTKYYRKRAILDMIYINQTADYYYCNICHKLVFKGQVKNIIMYCPNCHSIFSIHEDRYGRLVQQTRTSNYDKFTEDTFIDNGVRYSEKIKGIIYNVID